MTKFEQFLLDKGYKKYIKKDNSYIEVDTHSLSTMGNIDHRYILNGNEICFGLHEKGKPPTLIHPRPNIRFEREGKILTEFWDDAMNVVLDKVDYDIILEYMYDKTKVINIHGNN